MRDVGWILSFYLDENQLEKIGINRKKFPYLSWSPYDRLDIVEVCEFRSFFDNQFGSRCDCVAQQMHLIPENPVDFLWKVKTNESDKQDSCIIEKPGIEKSQFGLNCIISTRFSTGIKGTREFRTKIYEELNKEIEKNLSERDNTYELAAFNSLGAENIVFIVLANDIETFDIVINILSKATVKYENNNFDNLFSAISSFFSFNIKDWSGDPHADLIMRLNLKSAKEYEKVLDELSSQRINIKEVKKLLIGRCILDLRIPSSENIMKYFQTEGIFNGSSSFYKQYIASSRSYWVRNETQDISSFIVCYENEKVEKEYNINIRENGEYPLVQFVFKEYRRMICSNYSTEWSEILYKQYEVFQYFIEEYTNDNNVDNLFSLLNHVRTSLQHIRQATIPIAEVPYNNYAYAGSYNEILKMYHGIITSLFAVGCSMPHMEGTKQHDITFCVDFESTQAVHSVMHYVNRESKRFIIFHLPFNAFTDFNLNVKLLTHEIFHYIAPYDRKKRNKTIIKLWTNSIFQKFEKVLKMYIFENEIFEMVVQDLISDNMIYERIFEKLVMSMPELEDFILNDFTEGQNNIAYLLNNLKEAYIVILEEFREKFPKEFTSVYNKIFNMNEINKFMPEKKVTDDMFYAVCKEFLKKLLTEINLLYLRDDIYDIATASKEAFCDFNMIRLFNISLEEYIKLFYNILSEDHGKDFDLYNFENELTEAKINTLSFEYRLCIAFDCFYMISNEDQTTVLEKLIKPDENNGLNKFKKYCLKAYGSYIKNGTQYRTAFAKLFIEINRFWEVINQTVNGRKDFDNNIFKIVADLRKVNKLDKSIRLNTDFMYDFSAIDQLSQEDNLSLQKKVNDYINSSKSVYVKNNQPDDIPHVHTLEEYINDVCEISELMMNSNKNNNYNEPCWYRGLCNKEFDSLPSLFRAYDSEWKYKVGMSPYAYQTKILKDAYFLTMSMPTLWTEQYKDIPEHTCCLQHYGMRTNLLDFSLDMLVALHFAITPDNDDDKKKIDSCMYTPKVIIFNPVKYNKAVMSLAKGHYIDEPNFRQLSPVIFNTCDMGMDEYFVSNMSAEYSIDDTKKFIDEKYIPNTRVNKYPKPIIIRQSNSRVLSQSGIFLAYNLNAKMDAKMEQKKSKNCFSYLDLNAIQESYLELLPQNNKVNEELFMKQIYIHPLAIPRIKEQLEMMGITTPKMYPELSQIFKHYTNKH